jgi:hypothetical protein
MACPCLLRKAPGYKGGRFTKAVYNDLVACQIGHSDGGFVGFIVYFEIRGVNVENVFASSVGDFTDVREDRSVVH